MLRIRPEQMQKFDDESLQRFENDMWGYFQEYAPQMCKAAKEENVRLTIRKGIRKAKTYGFENRGPVRFYIELMFTFGCDFDTDPQHQVWIRALLNTEDDNQTVRAELLFESYKKFASNVFGQRNKYLRRALRHANEFSLSGLSAESPTDFRALIKQVYPERLANMNESVVGDVAESTSQQARQHGATSSASIAISLALTIFLGYKYDCDLLYPWLQRVFDRRDISGDEKFRLAAEKARIYANEAVRFWERS